MGKYKQGIFKPKNPSKYKGDVKKIVFRSSYELKMFMHIDTHDDVEWWSSEELVIPYWNPLTKRTHRYFPDVVLKKKSSPKIIVIEIKPDVQTRRPKKKTKKNGKPTVAFLREETEFIRNQSKWDAAETFCKKKGWEFVIMTEYDLGIKKRK